MRIAIVTGASSGIGKEFARQIARLYNRLDEIWLVARRTERLEELQKELPVPSRIFDGDLTQDNIYERIGKCLESENADIRMLVNGAGFGKVGLLEDGNEEEQLGMVDLNCRALTRMCMLCLPYLSRGSRVVNVSSIAAFAPQPGFAVYAATKSYVHSFSYALAGELKGKQVSVTAVCPGPVDTEFFDRAGELPGNSRNFVRSRACNVVRQALKDAVNKKKLSVYSVPMKAARVGAGLLPPGLVTAVMKKINHV